MHKWQSRWMVAVMALFLLGFSVVVWLKPAGTFSDSERRALAQFPELGTDFSEDFETYAQDQFPLRDTFRSIKAFSSFKIFRQLDNNGLYMKDGHLSRLSATVNESMLDHAASRFTSLYETYLEGANVYLSIVPDKNYFMADGTYPSLDYEYLVSYMQESLPYMKYLDIFPLLSLDMYYKTDSHWKQECIQPVAAALADGMGTDVTGEYEILTASDAWQGVYAGQIALPTAPDTLQYVTNDVLEQCIATSYDTGAPVADSIYDEKAVQSKDPYTFFPDDAVFVMENPAASTDRELILFRDSFGGSLAPYFCEAYAKVTLIDIRYVSPSLLGEWIHAEGQDVLFLYSTTMLNESSALK